MKITFTHKKKKAEIPVFGPVEVKLYAVGADYSADGYFAAVWASQELEPMPACAMADTELLAHIRVTEQDSGEYALQEVFCAKGVQYA